MSVREYAVLYLGGKGATQGAAGGTASNSSGSGAGPHRLDGPEHLVPSDSTVLDATTDRHGLLPKLSGLVADALRGDGTWGEVDVVDVSLVTVASAGATETVDVSVARTYDLTLDADCTLTLSGATTAEAHFVTVGFRQNGTGGWEVTHPGSVVWPDATAPTIDPDPSAVTWVTYLTLDGGTVWYGFPSGSGSSVGALDDLSDVTITTPAEGHAIRYRSGVWINEALAASGRWEVVMTGTGAGLEPVTNDDEDDWLYAEV